jgi:hypothetical protein
MIIIGVGCDSGSPSDGDSGEDADQETDGGGDAGADADADADLDRGVDADASADGADSACVTLGTSVTILANHGHVLLVSVADVVAGAAKTYDIQGTSAHNHQVTVTAAGFGSLQAGIEITVESTVAAAHSHTVTVGCL